MAKYKAPKISAAVRKKAAAIGLTTEGYHGTTHPFEEFRPSEANGWRDGRPDQYAGTHFGKDPAVSQHFIELAKLNKRLGQRGIGEDPRIIQALLPDLAKMKVVPQIDPTKLPSGKSFLREEDTSAIRDLLLHEFYKNDPEALERAIALFETANPYDRRTPFSASEQRVILEHLIGPEWNSYHTAKHNANWNDEVPRGTVLDAIGPDEFAELATNTPTKWNRDNPVRPEVQYARDIANKGVAGLQKQGYEGLVYQNTNPAELRGLSSRPRKTTDPESYIVFDPARIRDSKAKFDPASILSRNLMSSVAAATAVGVGAGLSTQNAEAAKPFHLTPGGQTGKSYADLIKLLAAKDKEIMSSMAAIPDETGPISASHISKADFPKFNPKFIGSGQGHATYGQGHYFATLPEVKDSYIEEFSDGNLYFHGKPVRGPGDMPGLRRFSTGDSKIVDTTRQDGRAKDDWHDDIFDQITYFEKHDPSTPEGQANKQAEIQNLYQKFLGYNTPEDAMEYANRYFVRLYEQATQVAQWAKAGNLEWKSSVPNTYDVELDVPRDKLWQLDTKLEENPDIFGAVKRAFEKAKVPFESATGTGLEATNDFNHGTGGQDKKTRLMLSRGVLDAGYPGAGYFDQQSRREYIDVAKANNPKQRKDKDGFNRSTPVHLDPEQMSATEKLLGLTKNYVMFPGSEKLIKILKKAPSEYTSDDYKILALATAAAAGGLGAGTAQAQDPTAFGDPMPEESAAKPERSYMQYLSELGKVLTTGPTSNDTPVSPAASSPSRLGFLGNVPNETDRLRGEYQLNRRAAEAHSPLMEKGVSDYSLLTNPTSSPTAKAFYKDPADMETYRRDKYLSRRSIAEHSELMKAAEPAFDELSNLFLDKYDEDGTLKQTLQENRQDITNNLLGHEYDSSNEAANAWVSNFFDAMNSESPRGQNAETPYRDPSEVGNNLSDYGNARFAFDKGGLLKKQMLHKQKLDILKTFQNGENAPEFTDFGSRVLGNIGSAFDDDTQMLNDERFGGKPENTVREALYWLNQGKDLATSPSYRTGGLLGKSPVPSLSWTTMAGMGDQGTDPATLPGASYNAVSARTYNIDKSFNGADGATRQYAKATGAINSKAPPMPTHLRTAAQDAKDSILRLEDDSHYDPAIYFAKTLKSMGLRPFYPSPAVTDAIGTIRDMPDPTTLVTALASGGLGFAGGGLRGLLGAASAVGKDFIYDYAQELPASMAIGQSFQQKGKGMQDYFFNQGQGLFDKDGNPIAADSKEFDKELAERNKRYDADYYKVANLGQELEKHEAMQPQRSWAEAIQQNLPVMGSPLAFGAAPAQGPPVTNPVLPKKTPNDIEYDNWNAQQAQTTRGKAYFDHLKTLRR